jgi:hypothetical protein
LVNISECASLGGRLTISIKNATELQEASSGTTRVILISPCISGEFGQIDVDVADDIAEPCVDVIANATTVVSSGTHQLQLLFRVDQSRCQQQPPLELWWIAIVVAGVVLIAAAIALAATKSKRCRRRVRPFADREQDK